jgi:hypothetical protein
LKIASFWHSGPLRNLESVCVASWVRLGFEVDIYSFAPVSGLPKGVVERDANEVLGAEWMERINPILHPARRDRQRMMNYSDLFRVALMRKGLGLWLDTDVLLFRHFDVAPAQPFFAWEDWHRIGSPVFYVPQDAPMLADYERVYDSPDLMPHWLGFRRRVLKPLIWKMQGKAFSPADLGLTIYGNDAFTRLARKHRLAQFAREKRSFYTWNAAETMRFYDPAYGAELWDDPAVLGLHVHHKPSPNQRPETGSMFDRAALQAAALLPDLVWQ